MALPSTKVTEHQNDRLLGPAASKKGSKSPNGNAEANGGVYTTTASDGCVCTYKNGDSNVNCVGDECTIDDVQHFRALLEDEHNTEW